MSHVLSSRLSSRPMGWSRNGLKAMAQLRAYCVSGGRVTQKHLTKSELTYRASKKILQKAAKVFKSLEKLDNVPLFSRGQDVPHFRHLRVIQAGLSLN